MRCRHCKKNFRRECMPEDPRCACNVPPRSPPRPEPAPGSRRFKCEYCDSDFPSLDALRTHGRAAHPGRLIVYEDQCKIYECPVDTCRKRYRANDQGGRDSGEIHVGDEHPDQAARWGCRPCPKVSYKTQTTFRGHLRIKHGKHASFDDYVIVLPPRGAAPGATGMLPTTSASDPGSQGGVPDPGRSVTGPSLPQTATVGGRCRECWNPAPNGICTNEFCGNPEEPQQPRPPAQPAYTSRNTPPETQGSKRRRRDDNNTSSSGDNTSTQQTALPQYGTPQYGNPQYGTSQYGTSQYGTSQYGTSQYGTSQYGDPQYGTSQYETSQYGTSQSTGGSRSNLTAGYGPATGTPQSYSQTNPGWPPSGIAGGYAITTPAYGNEPNARGGGGGGIPPPSLPRPVEPGTFDAGRSQRRDPQRRGTSGSYNSGDDTQSRFGANYYPDPNQRGGEQNSTKLDKELKKMKIRGRTDSDLTQSSGKVSRTESVSSKNSSKGMLGMLSSQNSLQSLKSGKRPKASKSQDAPKSREHTPPPQTLPTKDRASSPAPARSKEITGQKSNKGILPKSASPRKNNKNNASTGLPKK